tara:strand:- start:14270 stop:14983 length:714 start_codon:yes stop_codon:yes gene_type:complete
VKKGLTYVDIAVSVGIFVIYGVFLFIMFKPAIEEEYDDDYLTSIVQGKFMGDVSWEVVRTPIFIQVRGDMVGKNLEFQFPFDWGLSSLYMVDSSGVEVNFDKVGYKMIIPFGGWVDDEELSLFYTADYTEHTPGSYSGDYDAEEYVDIGVGEVITGIQKFSGDTGNLSETVAKPDDVLKSEWDYPERREFYLEMDSGEIIGIDDAPKDKKVNVLTFSTQFLDEYGETDDVIVTIKTW